VNPRWIHHFFIFQMVLILLRIFYIFLNRLLSKAFSLTSLHKINTPSGILTLYLCRLIYDESRNHREEGVTMLDWIMMLVLLAMGVLGYYVMKRLDIELDDIIVTDHIENVRQAFVLIYSDEAGHEEALKAILNELDQQGIDHMETTNSNIQDFQPFTHVMALSESDLDNLLLCHRARRLKPEIETLASCSKFVYRSVFKEQGVDWIVMGDRDPSLQNFVAGLG